MTKQEYEEQVDPEFCGIQSYMEWVKFSDSFPPLPAEPLPKIRFYLILSYGSIRVIGLYRKLGKDCSIVETSEFLRILLIIINTGRILIGDIFHHRRVISGTMIVVYRRIFI